MLKDDPVQCASRGKLLKAQAILQQLGSSGLNGKFYEDKRTSKDRPCLSDD